MRSVDDQAQVTEVARGLQLPQCQRQAGDAVAFLPFGQQAAGNADRAPGEGFAPNVLARGLLAGRTFTVGVITTDSFGRFSIPVMLGAEDALGVGQISVFMCDTRDDPDRERRYLDMLLSRQVDGLIVAGRRIEPRPSIGVGLGVPVVYAMTQSMDTDERPSCPTTSAAGG